MIFLIFLLSLAGIGAAVFVPGWSDAIMLAAPCALASLLLLLSHRKEPKTRPPPPDQVVIDGSNVMYWQSGEPQLEPIRDVIDTLRREGMKPGVIFDANAGHLLTGKYRHDEFFRKALGLPKDHVMVVPKGAPADPYILGAAKSSGARVVSNDRFQDWAHEHPEIASPGYLIRGGYKSGALWLGLDAAKV